MEEWQLDFKWLQVRHYIKDSMDRQELPDLNSVLFLIGIQELGYFKEEFTKEEKQDLMHIAVCTVLSDIGHYEFEGRDQDGWPHYRQIKNIVTKGVEDQEKLLKEQIVEYFRSDIKKSSIIHEN